MINHYQLCKKTAEWAVKRSHICVYEYQSYACGEFPDVLSFAGSRTELFEIKVSRSDFFADNKKDSRRGLKDTKVKVYPNYYSKASVTKTIRQKPHLGVQRYYVCPWGMIKPEEVEYFGLLWYREKDGKFFEKKRSDKFRRDLYKENAILVHALRKQVNVGNEQLLVKKYK